MYRAFLSTPKTVPCHDGDFVEWHNGISHYGFWAVVVKDPAWIALCEAAREHVKAFVHPGYQRAPHITVIACGLFDRNHFSAEQLSQQKAALNEMRISPFHLAAGPLNSFTTGPYLTVEDPAGTISQVRDRLAMISAEDTPVRYEPHTNASLYRRRVIRLRHMAMKEAACRNFPAFGRTFPSGSANRDLFGVGQ